MSDWKNKFINFMAGRYGIDNFNRFIMWAIVVCIVAGWFGIRGFSKLALAFLIIYIYRMLSKNYNQRYKENQVYLKYTEKIMWHFSNRNILPMRKQISKKDMILGEAGGAHGQSIAVFLKIDKKSIILSKNSIVFY